MDDQHDAPINPYQSPRSGFDSGGEAAGPERVYGLPEPIQMRGKLTAKEVRQAAEFRLRDQATISDKIKLALGIVVALFFVVALFTTIFLESGSLALGGLFIGLPLILVSVIFLAVWLMNKAYARYIERNTALETMTFTDEAITADCEDGKSVFRWSAFCQFLCSDEMVVLYREPGGDHVICPKRFFAREDDWTTFLALLRCKLPEDDESARQLATARNERLANEGRGVERTVEATDRQGRQPLLRVEGAISWKDWKHVQQLIGRPWLNRLGRVGCLLTLLIPATLAVYWQGIGGLGPVPLVWAAVILFFIVLLFVWPALRLRRQWKRQEGPFGPFEVRVWEEGMEFIERTSAAMVPWTGFAKFTLTERILLLYHVGAQVARFIPRAFFSSEKEWEALLRLVREKIPEE